MTTQPGPYGCPECGIDHPAGTRHRVNLTQARERDRRRQRAYRAGERVGKGWRGRHPEPLKPTSPIQAAARQWEKEQICRGVPANAEAVEYVKVLLADPCSYCGSREDVGIDHITTVSRGGASIANNLTAACRSCNALKRQRSLLSAVAHIAYRHWQRRQAQQEVA